jgi:hypothetical protein
MALPKLNIVAIDQLLCPFRAASIVCADQRSRFAKMIVLAR